VFFGARPFTGTVASIANALPAAAVAEAEVLDEPVGGVIVGAADGCDEQAARTAIAHTAIAARAALPTRDDTLRV
jgi:hypothetical protein